MTILLKLKYISIIGGNKLSAFTLSVYIECKLYILFKCSNNCVTKAYKLWQAKKKNYLCYKKTI